MKNKNLNCKKESERQEIIKCLELTIKEYEKDLTIIPRGKKYEEIAELIEGYKSLLKTMKERWK